MWINNKAVKFKHELLLEYSHFVMSYLVNIQRSFVREILIFYRCLIAERKCFIFKYFVLL